MLTTTSARPADELRDAQRIARLGEYVRETWRRRHYAWYVAISELRSRQMNSVLGNLWHLLNPTLQISVYYVIFGLVLDTTRGVDNFIGFLAVGVLAYGFTQRSTMAGAKSIFKNRGLIKIIWFPRVLLPITSTLTEAMAAVPAFAVMMLAAVVTGEPVSLTWVLVAPLFLLQTVFNAGVAMIASRATNHVADVQQVLPFVFRLGFYASGVLFNVESYVSQERYRLMFELNPLYCFIEMYRSFLLDRPLNPNLILSSSVWTAAVFVVGFVWFRLGEHRYGSD